jgi:DNA repair protein RadA/Sms
VVPTVEGSRPLLVEIQALATPTYYALPQRVANGFDTRRLAMLLCVLDRRAGVATGSQDVFLNIAGGLKVEEPAADLGIIAAVASSIRNKPGPTDVVFCGEVGLGGEVRSVSQIAGRVNEAQRLGFRRAIVPKRNAAERVKGIEIIGVDAIRAALETAEIL